MSSFDEGDGQGVLMSAAVQALNAFDSPALVLHGRIVPVEGDVIDDGALYIRGGKIIAVQTRTAPPPAGFETIKPVDTKGTMYPGMLDLHNHLVYNVITPWAVPQRFDSRAQWRTNKSYKEQISAPLGVLAKNPSTIPALVRYVETKALVSGTTAVQGMRSSWKPTETFFSGAVRNFEVTGDKDLPAAGTKIDDVDFKRPEKVDEFRKAVAAATQRNAAMFYHLCEGIDEKTRKHYTDLTAGNLLAKCVAAIHCLALNGDDFTSLDGIGCNIVWSPLSNSLLYGKTLDPKLLVNRRFTIGCDWSPSGGKNLLEELKVAWLTIQEAGADVPARALVEAVTKNAAAAVGWQKALGTLEPDKYADLVVIAGKTGDPYKHLIMATEEGVRLVLIAGYARYGDKGLMELIPSAGPNREPLTVGKKKKVIDNFDPGAKLDISFEEARKRLVKAMADLPAAQQELQDVLATGAALGIEPLMLDNEGEEEGADPEALFAAAAAVEVPQSVPLDPLTVVGDKTHFDRIEAIAHLPKHLKKLRELYS